MKISIGSDHGGFLLKEQVRDYLIQEGYEVIDCGCNSLDSTDYPIYAHKVANMVQNKEVDFGVLVCTSGVGMSMCANKHVGVRAALITNEHDSIYCRLHNNANVICMGAKHVEFEDAKKYVNNFLSTQFEGGRHERRVALIDKLD